MTVTKAAGDDVYGALAGWKRAQSPHGAPVSLQLAGDRDAWDTRDYRRVHVTMNDRQLRSLARDLARAAKERGIALHAPRPWWRRLFSRGGED